MEYPHFYKMKYGLYIEYKPLWNIPMSYAYHYGSDSYVFRDKESTTEYPHMSSVQNPSLIPLNPGWLMGNPRSWIITVPNI